MIAGDTPGNMYNTVLRAIGLKGGGTAGGVGYYLNVEKGEWSHRLPYLVAGSGSLDGVYLLDLGCNGDQ